MNKLITHAEVTEEMERVLKQKRASGPAGTRDNIRRPAVFTGSGTGWTGDLEEKAYYLELARAEVREELDELRRRVAELEPKP